MDQSEVGIRTLRRLRDMGVRLVLDDFGTGYSSLAYLKHLPLDTIKIDRTFVAGIDGKADRSIVEAVIALAHGLGISVVAEGIETERQVRASCAGWAATSARATCSPTRPGGHDRATCPRVLRRPIRRPPRRCAARAGRSRDAPRVAAPRDRRSRGCRRGGGA